jgi:hypothetical protein
LIGKINSNNNNVNDNNNNSSSSSDNSNNNNNNSPPPNPKAKSLTSQLLTLKTSLNLIKKAKGLEEAIQLSDDSNNIFHLVEKCLTVMVISVKIKYLKR